MADNEKLRKPFTRKNHPPQPPHGVKKAMQNFGVKDLREILDKKHQDRGDSQGEKKPDPKVKQPPPDPSYNYLRDPSRENPKSFPAKKRDDRKPPERSPSNKDTQHGPKNQPRPRSLEQDRNRNPASETYREETHTSPKPSISKEENKKKELRFSDTSKIIDSDPQFPKEGRQSFRGRNPRRGNGGQTRNGVEQKIVNPVNIKVELRTETGQRSCILDESTKIADIKHVPDHIQQRPPRGSFRGGRGHFRGRGRGRGSFRGRGGNARMRNQVDNSENTENINSDNNTSNKDSVLENDQKLGPDEQPSDTNGNGAEDYEEHTNEHEEFADSNDNYYESEYYSDSVERIENVDKNVSENPTNSFDPNLSETITITSSKYQDGEVKRSVEVKACSEDSSGADGTEETPKCEE